MSLADQVNREVLATLEAPEALVALGPPPLLDLFWILQGLEALGALEDLWHLEDLFDPVR